MGALAHSSFDEPAFEWWGDVQQIHAQIACVSDGKVSVVAFVSLMPDPVHDSQDQSVDSLTRLLDVADLNEGSAKRAKH